MEKAGMLCSTLFTEATIPSDEMSDD
jgi:hypothetical protein